MLYTFVYMNLGVGVQQRGHQQGQHREVLVAEEIGAPDPN